MKKEYTVVAIHGEGDRDFVNSLQQHRNNVFGQNTPDGLQAQPDEAPDVIVVLRDEQHNHRIELMLQDWEQVDYWKQLAGYDVEKRHWKTGATVKVTFAAGGKK